MDLNLFSIKVFLKVAETMSFTRAANELLLSQPAVSLQVQKIEQLFQAPFFIRHNTGQITLTAAGKTFRKHAEEMMRLRQTILQDMEKHSPGLQREVRIGACCIAGEQLLPLGLAAFREAYPDAQLMLSITKCDEVFRGLLAGNLHIGVTGLQPRSRFSRDLNKKKLMNVPLVFFEAGQTTPATGTIDLKRLRDQRLILREKGSGCRIAFERFLVENQLKLREFKVVSESESNDAIKNLVKDGYGISMLPEFMVRNEIAKGVFSAIRLQEGQPTMSFFLTYRKQDNPPKMQEHLIDFISDYPIADDPPSFGE
jgi:DNA-binding transcriptional LysR family regulator